MIALQKNTEELAKLLAEQSGQSPAEVIRLALEDRARRAGIAIASPTDRRPNLNRLLEISDRFAHIPVLDVRSSDEIIGYDDSGVPQ